MTRYNPPPVLLATTLGSGYLVALLIFTFFVSQITILTILGPIGHDLGTIQVLSVFNPSAWYDTVNAWSPEDKMRFEKHFMVDFWFHPTLYSLMFMAWLTHETASIGYSPIPYFLFLAVPAVGGFCDVMENSIHYNLIRFPNAATDQAVRLGGFFSLTKWLLVIPVGIWCLSRFISRRTKKASVKVD